jgi:hypothetical protein
MIERIANIILLVEDLRQETLLRRYLQWLGHKNRTMRVVRSEPGDGSGEQFVRESYASEVRALRRQLARTKACLIAMIDADTRPTEDRRRQFQRALKDADEAPRALGEPILTLIPKRTVETWILCLNSLEVSEVDNYRRDQRIDSKLIKQASEKLYAWTRRNFVAPDVCVPSLRECIPEFRRLPGDE